MDVISRPLHIMRNNLFQHTEQIFPNSIQILCKEEILVHCLDIPQRCINCIVFRRFAIIGESVGYHSLAHVLCKGKQYFPCVFEPALDEGKSWQWNHGIPSPVPKPVVTCNDAFLITFSFYNKTIWDGQ